MQIMTILIKNQDIKEKVLWFLEHLESDGVEILSQEDSEDFKRLMATREEPSVAFSEYLKIDLSLETIEYPSRFPLVEQSFQN
jgi:hypothetical protein